MALRPFETVSVITVPLGKGAVTVVPTCTLIPAGLEVTRSPERPVAVTLRLEVELGAESGSTVNTADWLPPPPYTVIVTVVDTLTVLVKMLNPPAVTPAGTTMLLFTRAIAGLLLVS